MDLESSSVGRGNSLTRKVIRKMAIYTHWIELEKDEGDIGQLCQDIANIKEADDPKLEYTREYNHTIDQDYYDIQFQSPEPLSKSTCQDLENRKGVLHVGFNEEKELD
jgi:hypothetical protein